MVSMASNVFSKSSHFAEDLVRGFLGTYTTFGEKSSFFPFFFSVDGTVSEGLFIEIPVGDWMSFFTAEGVSFLLKELFCKSTTKFEKSTNDYKD